MDQTIGKRLQKARLARNLEIEEAADATKIRPERIIDLEQDEYGHFPNLTYAKSFLSKYAHFLKVDIQDELENFQVNRSISLGDYQYLSSEPPRYAVESRKPAPAAREFRVPPWIIVALVLIVLVGIPSVGYWTLSLARLGRTDANSVAQDQSAANLATPSSSALAAQSVEAKTKNAGSPAARAKPAPTAAKSAPAIAMNASPAPSGTVASADRPIEVRRALPVVPGQESASIAPATPAPSTEPEKRLEVRALQRTWVQVVRDDQDSTPVFDGFTGPEDGPIKVEGKRFWLRVMKREAVEVLEDGQPIQGNSPDVVIN